LTCKPEAAAARPAGPTGRGGDAPRGAATCRARATVVPAAARRGGPAAGV